MRNSNMLAYVALVSVGVVLVFAACATLAPIVASIPAQVGFILSGGR